MSDFIVSARRFRPSDFETVVGQGHVTGTLRNAIARGQLAHAYLFCGPRGVGKTTCARIFAKTINCLSPREDGSACGECESCKGFEGSRSFNIHELDAASNNSVDDIRSLTEQVRVPPQVGKYSVYIIDEVHMLSAAAFNAFLKTLEEPPAHAIFVLATTEKHKILPTILSRCQIYDFNRIRVEDSVGYLRYVADAQGVEADDESLHLIALKADGGMRDALSMFDKAVSFCGDKLTFKETARTLNVLDYDTYFNIASLLLAGDYQAVLAALDEVIKNGFSPQSFAAGLNAHFRDLLMSKNPSTLPLLEVSGTLLERFKKQGAEFAVAFLFDAIGVLTAVDGTLRNASNQRLNVELALMKISGLGTGEGVEKKKGHSPILTEEPHALPKLNGTPEADAASGEPLLSDAKKSGSPPGVAASPQGSQKDANLPTPEPAREANAQHAPRTTILSGNTIGDILNSAPIAEKAATQQVEETAEDPEAEQKISAVREKFIAEVHRHRPRIAVALEEMTVEGNAITVPVPSEQLREEILRNRTEILELLKSLAEVTGHVELNVEVQQDDTQARKPIKAEDKLRHLTDKNPALTTLRKQLNLEVE